MSLLPPDFDSALREAVKTFWQRRSAGRGQQSKGRAKVIQGKNLEGFEALTRAVALHCGLPDASVFTGTAAELSLPGYYRPTKRWDVVVVNEGRLLAVLEFKSQVGSFGNNFNNRVEEALGSATDFGDACRESDYGRTNDEQATLHRGGRPDVRA